MRVRLYCIDGVINRGTGNQPPVLFLCSKMAEKERAESMQTYNCIWCGKLHTSSDNHKGKKYCSVECDRAAKKEEDKKRFIKSFNEKYDGCFEYVSGYEHSDGKIQCRCLQCGDILTRGARAGRQGCSYIKCAKCAVIELAKRLTDKKLQQEVIREQKAKEQEAQREARLWSACKECGKKFKGNRAGLKYCSDKCRRKQNNRRREINRRHKLRDNGEIHWDITLDKLVKRDKRICYICGEKVDMEADTNADTYGSIDHVIPVNNGGTHTWDNVKLAHRLCNTLKSDTIYQTPPRA